MIVRDMTPRDRRYVVPTWAQSSRYAGLRKRDRFALVDRIIDGGASVKVLSSDELTVHAWAAGDGELLHYVYVPPELRRHGFAKRVISALFGGDYPARINVTHEWPGISARFRFTPHLLLEAA